MGVATAAASPPVPALAVLLAQANGDYQAGRLQQAEALCRQILGREPRQADALQLLGLIARRVGRNDVAVELFRQSLAVAPGQAATLNNLGNALQDLGRVAEAIDAYSRALVLAPAMAEIHNNLGNALQAEGRFDAAVSAYRRAIDLQPAYAEAHSNLGTALASLGQLAAAEAAQRRALEVDPGDFAAHANLGNLLQATGRLDEAAASYRAALAIDRRSPELLNNLGGIVQRGGNHDEAIACFSESLALRPASPETLLNLGNALLRGGRQDEAAACYRQVLRLAPGNAGASHMLTALQGGASESAPREYVEKLFDDYAGEFDRALVDRLAYRTPEEIIALAMHHAPPPPAGWDLLDLGCGTGLVGIAAATQVRELVGVDLSAKMLARAAERGLYRRLVHADLLAMMQGEGDAGFDLIVAADVFVYLGRLDAVVAEVRRLLRPGGLFVFSVESLDALGDGVAAFRLNPSGRYAHASAYLQQLAANAGFVVAETREVRVRMENGKPVLAWLSAWRG